MPARAESVSPLKKVTREAAAQRRPARIERKNRVLPRNDRPYGLKRPAFQTENAIDNSSGGKGTPLASAQGCFLPPGPPSFPQRAFIWRMRVSEMRRASLVYRPPALSSQRLLPERRAAKERGQTGFQSVSTLKKVKREGGSNSAARPKVSGKTALFPRNDRPYGLKRAAFQTENALK